MRTTSQQVAFDERASCDVDGLPAGVVHKSMGIRSFLVEAHDPFIFFPFAQLLQEDDSNPIVVINTVQFDSANNNNLSPHQLFNQRFKKVKFRIERVQVCKTRKPLIVTGPFKYGTPSNPILQTVNVRFQTSVLRNSTSEPRGEPSHLLPPRACALRNDQCMPIRKINYGNASVGPHFCASGNEQGLFFRQVQAANTKQ